MKIQTVNVIEVTNGDIQNLSSFPETSEGNQAAEELFGLLITEHNAGESIPENIDAMIEDGRYNDQCGYELFIVHSV